MEMLVALSVFALLAVMAAQSLAGLGRGVSRLGAGLEQAQSRAAAAAFLESVSERLVSGPSLSGPEDLGLSIIREREREWIERDGPNGLTRAYRLDSDGHDLELLEGGLGRRYIVLRRDAPDGSEIIAVSPLRITAPRDCRYDAVGRRCLEQPA